MELGGRGENRNGRGGAVSTTKRRNFHRNSERNEEKEGFMRRQRETEEGRKNEEDLGIRAAVTKLTRSAVILNAQIDECQGYFFRMPRLLFSQQNPTIR